MDVWLKGETAHISLLFDWLQLRNAGGIKLCPWSYLAVLLETWLEFGLEWGKQTLWKRGRLMRGPRYCWVSARGMGQRVERCSPNTASLCWCCWLACLCLFLCVAFLYGYGNRNLCLLFSVLGENTVGYSLTLCTLSECTGEIYLCWDSKAPLAARARHWESWQSFPWWPSKSLRHSFWHLHWLVLSYSCFWCWVPHGQSVALICMIAF